MSNLQRIQRVMNFYYKRGCNKESINKLYYKILKDKFKNYLEQMEKEAHQNRSNLNK